MEENRGQLLQCGPVSEFNIAGGEPLLYKDLPELIQYITSKGISCSIITNGSLMTREWIQKNARYFKTIGFSIDSFVPETMIRQGRCTNNREYLSLERFKDLCRYIKEANPACSIKLNTVVTALNATENIAQTIRENQLPISRWKILKIKRFRNDTFDNSDIDISDGQYLDFVKTNLAEFGLSVQPGGSMSAQYTTHTGLDIVVEKNLQDSYLIIDANGYLVNNSREEGYMPVIDCVSEDFGEGLRKLSFDEELYLSRYQYE